jgi:DNA modification methylase
MRVKPYYERDGITIFHGDCREVLPTLERRAADLLVADPPYGVNFRSNRGKNFGPLAGDEDAAWVPAALDLALDVLRPNRHAYVFGPEDLLPERLAARTELIWDKCQHGSGNLASCWGPAHEPITFATFIPSKANRARGDGRGVARMRSGSVLRYPRPNSTGVKRHPTEKPIPLLRRIVESSSLLGEVVLDPTVGCGSTLIAAIAEGRRGIGIELDEGFVATAAERVDAALDAMRELAPALS